MDNENIWKSVLNEDVKQEIREILHIDPDHEILNPMVDLRYWNGKKGLRWQRIY